MTDKQIAIDKVDVKECEYYCNGKCERYEEFVEADYANYSVKCICEEENVLGTYDICDYQQLTHKEQECKRLKWYMQEIRIQELSHLDIEWDEYETHCANTEYSNIINLVEEALEERSPEDCRYDR